jgi:thioesterase-3
VIAQTEVKVRGFHLDFYGHVNNSRYLEFLEDSRWDIVESDADPGQWQTREVVFVVVNININYRRPARFGEVLEIRSWVKKIGKMSAVIRQEVTLKGTDKKVIDADVTFAVIDRKIGKAVVIPNDILALLKKYQP